MILILKLTVALGLILMWFAISSLVVLFTIFLISILTSSKKIVITSIILELAIATCLIYMIVALH